jgi:hypothetical protein
MLYKKPKVNHRDAGNGFSEHLRNSKFSGGGSPDPTPILLYLNTRPLYKVPTVNHRGRK